jgi:hypothetical protein
MSDKGVAKMINIHPSVLKEGGKKGEKKKAETNNAPSLNIYPMPGIGSVKG